MQRIPKKCQEKKVKEQKKSKKVRSKEIEGEFTKNLK